MNLISNRTRRIHLCGNRGGEFWTSKTRRICSLCRRKGKATTVRLEIMASFGETPATTEPAPEVAAPTESAAATGGDEGDEGTCSFSRLLLLTSHVHSHLLHVHAL
jgi:hypothetical protein